MSEIVVVDDEEKLCKLLVGELSDAGHVATGFSNPVKALERIEANPPDIVITDLRMREMDGIELLKKTKSSAPATDVIVMTAYASVETALETMKLGAYDYITKPFKTDELVLLVRRVEEKRALQTENLELRSYLSGRPADEIIGSSRAILQVRKLIRDLSSTDVPVLVRGESGTGKELVARTIHNASRRAGGPFIAINCAAIPESLLESELFGYEKGAFTGASRRKLGHFQLAAGGTLLLDEIGDLPLSLQVKLLRVLENHRVTPLGAVTESEVDIRLITATNQQIEELIRRGVFREDLYYRINVFPIVLPPLRQRKEDIRDLARHMLSAAGRDPNDLSAGALRALLSYDWPGNIRELRNVLERAMIVKREGAIGEAHILIGPSGPLEEPRDEPGGLNLEEMEKRLVLRALRLASGNKSEAARLLGITRRALYGRLDRYGIEE